MCLVLLVMYDLYSVFPHLALRVVILVICIPEWRIQLSFTSLLADSRGDRQTPGTEMSLLMANVAM